jgi:hypothetical protein
MKAQTLKPGDHITGLQGLQGLKPGKRYVCVNCMQQLYSPTARGGDHDGAGGTRLGDCVVVAAAVHDDHLGRCVRRRALRRRRARRRAAAARALHRAAHVRLLVQRLAPRVGTFHHVMLCVNTHSVDDTQYRPCNATNLTASGSGVKTLPAPPRRTSAASSSHPSHQRRQRGLWRRRTSSSSFFLCGTEPKRGA